MDDSFQEHLEPEELFFPLSREQYASFYALEMDNFQADIHFYQQRISCGSKVLELGCGTGRIGSSLSAAGHSVVGVDISFPMVKRATRNEQDSVQYVCMDMTQMGFKTKFDHVLIPYNTLNLLRHKTSIDYCLQQIHQILNPGGTLLLHLYIPSRELLALKGSKLFQFQLFPLDSSGGKLIKETLRSVREETGEIRLEERYRVRPMAGREKRKDYHHVFHLAGFSLQKWMDILQECGFHALSLYGGYDCRPYDDDSLLLIQASPSLDCVESTTN